MTVRDSPTAEDIRIDEFTLVSSSFDVQKTESIISPYIGYVNLELLHRFTEHCGPLLMKYADSRAWDNVADALLYSDADSCYCERSRYDVKFWFSFQDDKWVYKNITRADDNKDDLILAQAFGKHLRGNHPITEQVGLQFNKKWYEFAQKISETKLNKTKK